MNNPNLPQPDFNKLMAAINKYLVPAAQAIPVPMKQDKEGKSA